MHASTFLALSAGSERVAAWADLLDDINVFPVADGDTGRNLKISLSPLVDTGRVTSAMVRALIESATGNSGNIAAAFFSRFLNHVAADGWRRAISSGRTAAWQSVADPKPGTMLSVFDALDLAARELADDRLSRRDVDDAVSRLAESARSTASQLPELRQAGVMDAGALGMFIFFEAFLHRLSGDTADPSPVTDRFAGLLKVTGDVAANQFPGYCVNTIIRAAPSLRPPASADLGDSVVAVADGDRLRVHLHTRDRRSARNRLETLGEIVDWKEVSMSVEGSMMPPAPGAASVHVMTDAAGSLTRREARRLGVTLLDSYLLTDDRRVPETLFDAQELYRAMLSGRRISTAQASAFEKRQSYQSALARYEHVLYLAVGSVYTGNYATACRWGNENGREERFTVVDTGAASGRLGLIVRLVADAARRYDACDKVLEVASKAVASCGELLFLDQLRFLVAGGRLSKSKGFFGDLLGIKPVISPQAEGAVKAGSVRRTDEQVPFAVRYLKKRFSGEGGLTFLLQYSDNEARVRKDILPEIQRHFSGARIEVSRLSLTSGAHMGPGTWGLAFCPDL